MMNIQGLISHEGEKQEGRRGSGSMTGPVLAGDGPTNRETTAGLAGGGAGGGEGVRPGTAQFDSGPPSSEGRRVLMVKSDTRIPTWRMESPGLSTHIPQPLTPGSRSVGAGGGRVDSGNGSMPQRDLLSTFRKETRRSSPPGLSRIPSFGHREGTGSASLVDAIMGSQSGGASSRPSPSNSGGNNGMDLTPGGSEPPSSFSRPQNRSFAVPLFSGTSLSRPPLTDRRSDRRPATAHPLGTNSILPPTIVGDVPMPLDPSTRSPNRQQPRVYREIIDRGEIPTQTNREYQMARDSKWVTAQGQSGGAASSGRMTSSEVSSWDPTSSLSSGPVPLSSLSSTDPSLLQQPIDRHHSGLSQGGSRGRASKERLPLTPGIPMPGLHSTSRMMTPGEQEAYRAGFEAGIAGERQRTLARVMELASEPTAWTSPDAGWPSWQSSGRQQENRYSHRSGPETTPIGDPGSPTNYFPPTERQPEGSSYGANQPPMESGSLGGSIMPGVLMPSDMRLDVGMLSESNHASRPEYYRNSTQKRATSAGGGELPPSPIDRAIQEAPSSSLRSIDKQHISCNLCRARKSRCDGEPPIACGPCVRRGTGDKCMYVDRVRRRGPGKKRKAEGTGTDQGSIRSGEEGDPMSPRSGGEPSESGRSDAIPPLAKRVKMAVDPGNGLEESGGDDTRRDMPRHASL